MAMLENGTLVFPKRGPPPRCPDGYDVDPNDPYVFHPVWPDCIHRFQRAFTCQSGMTKYRPSCKAVGSDITFAICDACDLPKE